MNPLAPYFLVTWLNFSCPGGFLERFWPDMLKPLACTPISSESASFKTRQEALAKVQDLGPWRLPAMQWCKADRCWNKRITWNTIAEVE